MKTAHSLVTVLCIPHLTDHLPFTVLPADFRPPAAHRHHHRRNFIPTAARHRADQHPRRRHNVRWDPEEREPRKRVAAAAGPLYAEK